MDSSFEIGSDYGELIRENNKLQKLVTDLNLQLNPCQVKFHLQTSFNLGDLKIKICKILLKIVVIGSQSAGKSSVLEKIVGKNFLPTGNGCVTKRPLHLNLLQADQNSARISYYDYEKESEVKQNNLNLNELAEAIRQANSFQDSKRFMSEPINVSISGPQNPDLTLIDFPGVVADPNEREIIINMIKPNINKDTSIILAVSR